MNTPCRGHYGRVRRSKSGDLQAGIEEAEGGIGYRVMDPISSRPSTALNDTDVIEVRDSPVARAGNSRSRTANSDVSAVDVMDSLSTRIVRDIAHIIRLRGPGR